jgi:hypothetical protein
LAISIARAVQPWRDPGREELADLVALALLLVVEAVIIVVVLGARDELLEGSLPVLGQRELFVERDIHGSLSGVRKTLKPKSGFTERERRSSKERTAVRLEKDERSRFHE